MKPISSDGRNPGPDGPHHEEGASWRRDFPEQIAGAQEVEGQLPATEGSCLEFRFSAVTGVVTFASAGRCLSAAALASSGRRAFSATLASAARRDAWLLRCASSSA